jgi:ankyrin repeat protein
MESYIVNLPVELIFDIVSRLHYSDIIRLCRTSPVLNDLLCHNDIIWKILYQRDISTKPPNTSYYEAYRRVIQDTRNFEPNEILIYAAQHGYNQLVERMLEEGANDYNWAMESAAFGGHRDIVERMLEVGATDYNEALESAAFGGHRDIVERMLELVTQGYDDAMIEAAHGGHEDIVELIRREREIDINFIYMLYWKTF